MIVGFSGHRPNRLPIGEAAVSARLSQVVLALQDAAPVNGRSSAHTAISALAEGSDRLFAIAALEHGLLLAALLPFKTADYETTFGDPATTPLFRTLLTRAQSIVELPGSLADDTAAYESMGREIVDRSTVMLAVWDGKPSAGRGGTPEIIEYAIARKCPLIWIDAGKDREPMQLRSMAPSLKTSPLLKTDYLRLISDRGGS